jgi:hypothetical protein
MTAQPRRYQTQWASQFLVAAELTRRGYLVSLTFGNAKFTDLMVETPSNKIFSIDVKGQSGKNWWIIKPPEPNKDRYFILVYVPKNVDEAPAYSILSSTEMDVELKQEQERSKQAEVKRGEPYKDWAPGMVGLAYSQPFKPDYKDRWDKLPK